MSGPIDNGGMLTEVYCPELAATSWDESIVLYSDREVADYAFGSIRPTGYPKRGAGYPKRGAGYPKRGAGDAGRLLRLGRLFA